MNESNTNPDKQNNSAKGTSGMDIKIYHRVNRLKMKAGGSLNGGPGRLDPNAVDKADVVIQNMANIYPQELQKALSELDEKWEEARGMAENTREADVEMMSNLANQIKDLAGLFGYSIMEYFAASLRDFILESALNREEHVVIVQAHVDVMWVVYRENLKDDAGPVAEELKRMVAEAIEKYS